MSLDAGFKTAPKFCLKQQSPVLGYAEVQCVQHEITSWLDSEPYTLAALVNMDPQNTASWRLYIIVIGHHALVL